MLSVNPWNILYSIIYFIVPQKQFISLEIKQKDIIMEINDLEDFYVKKMTHSSKTSPYLVSVSLPTVPTTLISLASPWTPPILPHRRDETRLLNPPNRFDEV